MIADLKQIRRKEPERWLRLLKYSVDRFLPDPGVGIGAHVHDAELDRLSDAIVESFRARLRLKSSETKESRTRILELISKEIVDAVLSEEDRAAARGRFGDRGQLETREYNINFSETDWRWMRELGFRKAHVLESMVKADIVEHFPLPTNPEQGESAISLFTQRRTDGMTGKSFSWLVLASRLRDQLMVRGAWRIFHEILPLEPSLLPHTILERFTERYALELAYQSETVGRLILGRSFQSDADHPEQAVELAGPPTGGFIFTAVARSIPNERLDVAVAFAIDGTAYTQDLNAIGVESPILELDETMSSGSLMTRIAGDFRPLSPAPTPHP